METALEGPIMGSVQQLDFYKNGKLQYLFNTAEKIHLIDRNGNYVERYPIALRSPATSPLALFDYERTGIIACLWPPGIEEYMCMILPGT
jgi:hypothetical protein